MKIAAFSVELLTLGLEQAREALDFLNAPHAVRHAQTTFRDVDFVEAQNHVEDMLVVLKYPQVAAFLSALLSRSNQPLGQEPLLPAGESDAT